jgi:hypothetical protein
MMHDCADANMRDLLPGYVHNALPKAERARVAAHLAACTDCAAEAELIRTAMRAFPAPAVDVGRIVKALPRTRRRPGRGGWLAGRERLVAAAVGFAVLGTVSVVSLHHVFVGNATEPVPSGASRAPRAAVAVSPAEQPAGQPAEQPATQPATQAGAATLVHAPAIASSPAAAPATAASISFGGGLSDLTDEQLDTLLGEIDTLDALPSVEPETHLMPIVPPDEGEHRAR